MLWQTNVPLYKCLSELIYILVYKKKIVTNLKSCENHVKPLLYIFFCTYILFGEYIIFQFILILNFRRKNNFCLFLERRPFFLFDIHHSFSYDQRHSSFIRLYINIRLCFVKGSYSVFSFLTFIQNVFLKIFFIFSFIHDCQTRMYLSCYQVAVAIYHQQLNICYFFLLFT